ncbi:MAG: hypothetical protein HC915_18090 [Anaerolineae bacterium]|nr:hypothetical protein [Anaerolineae bacterium]
MYSPYEEPYQPPKPKRGLPDYDTPPPAPPNRGWFCVGVLSTAMLGFLVLALVLILGGQALLDDLTDQDQQELEGTRIVLEQLATGLAEIALVLTQDALTPTPTLTLTPSDTPTATLTATLTATATPSPTATFTATASLTPTATMTPSPTPLPNFEVEQRGGNIPGFLDGQVRCNPEGTEFTFTFGASTPRDYARFRLEVYIDGGEGQFTSLVPDTLESPAQERVFGFVLVEFGTERTFSLNGLSPEAAIEELRENMVRGGQQHNSQIAFEWRDRLEQSGFEIRFLTEHDPSAEVYLNLTWTQADNQTERVFGRIPLC